MSTVNILPEDDVWFIILMNQHTGAADQLRLVLPAILFGDPYENPETVPPSAKVDPSRLKRYVGDYSRSGGVIRISMVNEQLLCDDSIIVPRDDHTFFHPATFSTLTFVEEKGEITHIHWSERGQTFRNPRVRKVP